MLQHFCNSNEVYAFVDLLSNSYFGILSKIYRMFTWTQLLQCELGDGGRFLRIVVKLEFLEGQINGVTRKRWLVTLLALLQ